MSASDEHVIVARAVLWTCAVLYGVVGLVGLATPAALAALVEIQLLTPTARVDFGAMYGGLEAGLGVALGICARRRSWLQPGLIVAAVTLAGFAVARAAGLLLNEGAAPLMRYLLVAEVVATVACAWAARRVDY